MFIFEVFVILVGVLFYNFYWKRRNLPPGPTPLPLFGNTLTLGTKNAPYDIFLKWKEQYGSVYTYWLGEKPVVSLANFDTIRETILKDGDAYTGTEFFPEWQKEFLGTKENYGIFALDGEKWRNQRRFTLQVFRNFGMGRTIIEDMIMKEVDRLLAKANESIKTGNKDFQLNSIVEICIGSIINQILLGYRFIGETEQEFYEIKNIMTKGIQIRGNPLATIVMFYPRVLKHLPYFRDYWKELNEAGQIFQDFISKQISSQLETFKLEGSPEEATNFGEAFFIEMHRREQNGDTSEFNLLQLRNLLIDLWIAGQETTTNTTNFGILYLLTNPEAQAKMQMELDKIIGNERRVTLADRSDLPYTNAVINETQRLCNLLPQNVLHYTTKDVVINGYKIAKGTTIAPQISCLLYDKDVFPNPKAFKPERFLNEKGQLKKFEELVPFSIGKRQCVGESLARNELYLFLANLFHEFKVMPSDLNKPPSLEKINGITVQPMPYTVKLERRIPLID